MSGDLMARVDSFLEIHELPESTGLMEELVAEVKRLRELGKMSLDFYIVAIKAQHRNFQLVADTGLEWIDEAERLQEQLAANETDWFQMALSLARPPRLS